MTLKTRLEELIGAIDYDTNPRWAAYRNALREDQRQALPSIAEKVLGDLEGLVGEDEPLDPAESVMSTQEWIETRKRNQLRAELRQALRQYILPDKEN